MDRPPSQAVRWARRFAPLALIGLAIVLFFALGLHRAFTLEAFAARRAALDAFVAAQFPIALALFMVGFALCVLCALPVGIVFTIGGGYLFGAWIAAPASVIAATLGAAALFMVARSSVGAAIQARAGSALDRFEQGFRADGFNYILALRLFPGAVFSVTTLAAAAFELRLRPFVLATFIGVTPITIILSLIGAGMRSALDAGEAADPAMAARQMLTSPEIIGALGALALAALAPILIKRLRKSA